VHLSDRDPAALALAQDLGAGLAAVPPTEPELVVLAVPPASVAAVLEELERLYLHAIFTDLASVKSEPQADLEQRGLDASRFIGGHPLAGRERSGAGAARADLFEGRPWVLTPSASTAPLAVARATWLAEACGASVVLMSPERHDEAVALVSHVPQLMASLTAARLEGADSDLVALAGQGVRDVTRVAASDPALWTQILAANASAVLPVLDRLAQDLDAARAALRAGQPTSRSDDSSPDRRINGLTDLLERGNTGRGRLPGKHGTAPATYTMVPVVVPDAPGELARLLVACGAAGINVEDVSIEHSPDQPVGLVEIAVRPAAATRLADELRERGWSVHF
jgi:prephenate dehydrogenase